MAVGTFAISLDFELFWGMRNTHTLASYGSNILGVRDSIPAMLQLFRKHEIRATWAAVGMLLFDSKKELRRFIPELKPSYLQPGMDPYPDLDQIGDDERSDPYHYGLSLARQILSEKGMELASHTFSHFYCLEAGQNPEQFKADMECSVASLKRLGVRPTSVVFPRNQYSPDYLKVCSDLGFRAYRGTQAGWMYRTVPRHEELAIGRRAAQLADVYLNISGDGDFQPSGAEAMVNLPASRFLRPYQAGRRALDHLRLRRIHNAMTFAAQSGKSFHLWWHPHNFGNHLAENLAFLTKILRHHVFLRDRYGMRSVNMQDEAQCLSSRNKREAAAPDCTTIYSH